MSHIRQMLAGLLSLSLCGTILFFAEQPGMGQSQETPKRKPRFGTVTKAPPAEQQPEVVEEAPPQRRQPRRPAEPADEAPAQGANNGEAPGQRQARPTAEPLRVVPLPKELEQFLLEWEVASAKVQNLTGSFKKFEYETTFQVERQAEGKFSYEAPDCGHYEVSGVLPPKAKAGMKAAGNPPVPFKLEAFKPEHWICNGKEIYLINHAEKTFAVDIIPPDQRGKNIINGPLPFLFGMKAEQAKKRYFLTVLPQTTPELMWLQVKPRLQQDAVNWKEATVIIDRTIFLPKAVRTEAPSGTQTTVHHFDIAKMKETMNKPRGLWQGDPLVPQTRGYKRIQMDGSVQQAKGEGPVPGRAQLKPRPVQRPTEAPSQEAPENAPRVPTTKKRLPSRPPAE